MNQSGYRRMWIFAMFDLPVTNKRDRKEYTRFRKALLREGFEMLQFSVYAKFFPNADSAKTVSSGIKRCLPPKGAVRIFALTDVQYQKMECFFSGNPTQVEEQPEQLMLF